MGKLTPFAAKGFQGQTRSTLKFLTKVKGAPALFAGIGVAGFLLGIAATKLCDRIFEKKQKDFDNTGLVVEHVEKDDKNIEQTFLQLNKVEEETKALLPEYHIAKKGDSAYGIAGKYYTQNQVPQMITPLMERNSWGIDEKGMTTNLHPQDTVYLVN